MAMLDIKILLPCKHYKDEWRNLTNVSYSSLYFLFLVSILSFFFHHQSDILEGTGWNRNATIEP